MMGYESGIAYLWWMSAAVAAFLLIGFIYACWPIKPEHRIGTTRSEDESMGQRKRRRIRHDGPAIR